MSSTEAQICEIFSSIQGEGLYVGERQVFIRFAGCNLNCQYCDTPQALVIPKDYKIEITPGKHDFKNINNPVTIPQLLEHVRSYLKPKGLHHSLCLTGGEPLLQVDFLKNFLPQIKDELPVYLETNGVLPKHLEEIIDYVDFVSFDIKLASSTGLSSYMKEHRQALEIAYRACRQAGTKKVFVKIVFLRETRVKELDDAVKMMAEIDPEIPLVLQPVTPTHTIKHRPNPDQILAFQAVAKRKLKDVRVIPQVHKILGQL